MSLHKTFRRPVKEREMDFDFSFEDDVFLKSKLMEEKLVFEFSTGD